MPWGSWFVCSSRSLPFPAILPTLSAGQVAGSSVPTAVLPALPGWVLASGHCTGTLCPQKTPAGALMGRQITGAHVPVGHRACARLGCSQLWPPSASSLQRVLLGAEVCAPAAPGAGKSHGWQDPLGRAGAGQGGLTLTLSLQLG